MLVMNADKINVVKIALNVRVDATTPPSPTRRCLPGMHESSPDLSQQSIDSSKFIQAVHTIPNLCAAIPSVIRQLQQGVQQHIGAILNLIPIAEFSR
jgi:hypothetical protein